LYLVKVRIFDSSESEGYILSGDLCIQQRNVNILVEHHRR
jgi:hypothetical protein